MASALRLALEVATLKRLVEVCGPQPWLAKLQAGPGSYRSKTPAFDAAVLMFRDQKTPNAEVLDAAWREISRLLIAASVSFEVWSRAWGPMDQPSAEQIFKRAVEAERLRREQQEEAHKRMMDSHAGNPYPPRPPLQRRWPARARPEAAGSVDFPATARLCARVYIGPNFRDLA